MILDTPDLHPSIFQNDNNKIKSNMKNARTMISINNERNQKFSTKDIANLISPGSYKLTEPEGLSGSNTNSLFKNLYGETLLTFLFFSSDNINNIQKLIRMYIFKEMKEIVDNQSNNDLMIIMRSIFLTYSEHPMPIDDSMSDTEKNQLLKSYTIEVNRLNQIVIDTCIPLVASQLQQYLTYLHDASTPLHIMDKPVNTSVSGTKSYRSQTQVLLGGNL